MGREFVSASKVFHADEPGRRIVKRLPDGVTLIFHRPSGLTHILGSPAPELLEALGEGAADIDMLIERLSRDHDLGDAGEARAALAARLAELETAGLVWRA